MADDFAARYREGKLRQKIMEEWEDRACPFPLQTPVDTPIPLQSIITLLSYERTNPDPRYKNTEPRDIQPKELMGFLPDLPELNAIVPEILKYINYGCMNDDIYTDASHRTTGVSTRNASSRTNTRLLMSTSLTSHENYIADGTSDSSRYSEKRLANGYYGGPPDPAEMPWLGTRAARVWKKWCQRHEHPWCDFCGAPENTREKIWLQYHCNTCKGLEGHFCSLDHRDKGQKLHGCHADKEKGNATATVKVVASPQDWKWYEFQINEQESDFGTDVSSSASTTSNIDSFFIAQIE